MTNQNTAHDVSFGNRTPILRLYDVAATLAFYVGFLGFSVAFEHRFDDAAPLYLGISHGDCVLHLSQHYGDGTPGSAVRIPVAEIEAFVARLPKDYRFARPGVPAPTPWGTRELTIADPAGNRLTFFASV